MTRISDFSPRRCCLLIWNNLFINRSRILISSAALFVLLILISGWNIIGPNFPMFYRKYYLLILFFSGLAIYGRMFKDLHHEVKSATWLTTPATMFEKLVSCILLGTVIMTIYIMTLVFLSSLLSEGINLLLFESCHKIFNPFAKDIIRSTACYLILLSIFFLGSIYFKKYSLVKTFLNTNLYLLIFIFMVLFIFKNVFNLSFYDFIFGFDPEGRFQAVLFRLNSFEPVWSVTKWVVRFVFWWVIAPLCWVISYIRLKETQI